MPYGFGVLRIAILLVLGLVWCNEVLKRFPKDLAEVRGETDATTKGVIVLIWILTVIIAGFIGRFLLGLILPVLDAL
jgi:hypothetical protein